MTTQDSAHTEQYRAAHGQMVLVSSLTSPYGRKVRMAAVVLGLTDRIRIVHADPRDAGDPLRVHNPLGKIPLLILDTGERIFDSAVILEYLDALAGGDRLIPVDPVHRFTELTRAQLADGIIDASLLMVYEGRFRDESQRSPQWLEHQRGKIFRALDAFVELLPVMPAPQAPPKVCAITLSCALSYLDWREPVRWRDAYPQLVEWLDAFERAVPAFNETARPVES